jgi:hypothetical protein
VEIVKIPAMLKTPREFLFLGVFTCSLSLRNFCENVGVFPRNSFFYSSESGAMRGCEWECPAPSPDAAVLVFPGAAGDGIEAGPRKDPGGFEGAGKREILEEGFLGECVAR